MEFNEIYKEYEPNKKFSKKTQIIISVVIILALIAMMIGGVFIGLNINGVTSKAKDMVTDLPLMEEMYKLIKQNYYKDISYEEFQIMVAASMAGNLDAFSGMYVNDVLSVLEPTIGLTFSVTDYNEYVVSLVHPNKPVATATCTKAPAGVDKNLATIGRGDMLVEVNGTRVNGAVQSFLQNLMRQDNVVNLTIVKQGDELISTNYYTFSCAKDIAQGKNAYYIDDPDTNAGYIRLVSFTGTAVQDFVQACYDFEQSGNNKLILDLRGNGGGGVDILAKIAPLLIESNGESNNLFLMKIDMPKSTPMRINSVVESFMVNNGSSQSVQYTNDYLGKRIKNFDMVVLCDGHSASASEALIGILQYYKNIQIIGNKTYGKGVAQREFYFDNMKYVVALTAGEYYLPKMEGEVYKEFCIHGVGFTPIAENIITKDILKNNIFEENAVIRAKQLLLK
ncbi:MAG: S41 family peptidase [Clostridia bacterium]